MDEKLRAFIIVFLCITAVVVIVIDSDPDVSIETTHQYNPTPLLSVESVSGDTLRLWVGEVPWILYEFVLQDTSAVLNIRIREETY